MNFAKLEKVREGQAVLLARIAGAISVWKDAHDIPEYVRVQMAAYDAEDEALRAEVVAACNELVAP